MRMFCRLIFMRGEELQQPELFSYCSLTSVSPLHPIRFMVDEAFKELSKRYKADYPKARAQIDTA